MCCVQRQCVVCVFSRVRLKELFYKCKKYEIEEFVKNCNGSIIHGLTVFCVNHWSCDES